PLSHQRLGATALARIARDESRAAATGGGEEGGDGDRRRACRKSSQPDGEIGHKRLKDRDGTKGTEKRISFSVPLCFLWLLLFFGTRDGLVSEIAPTKPFSPVEFPCT